MRLSDLNEVTDDVRKQWESKGYKLSTFDRAAVTKRTKEAPTWLHFGAGNIFRAFPAAFAQDMLEAGRMDTGIIACEGFDYDIIGKAYAPYDNRSLLVTLKSNGSLEKRVIDSVVESLTANPAIPEDMERLLAIFEAPSLQMVSFTITEKGYAITRGDGSLLPVVEADFAAAEAGELTVPKHLMGLLTYLLYQRFKAGKKPVAMVSMDNCSHNGDKLKSAIVAYAKRWAYAKIVPAEFLAYVEDPAQVSFPWSMIDKITPRPDAQVVRMLEEDGFEDTDIIITDKKTYTAPFVNAEETQYLVIEDTFPAGRPAFEKAGVLFTKRETVDRVEKMKVCTCLNPLHTSLAIFGCLLSYTSIHAEMKDVHLVSLIKQLGYKEGMPVVVDPGIIRPKDFIDAVIEQRLPNPFMPDTPQRIATDTSQKIPIRFGETLKAYVKKNDTESLKNLVALPLTLAAYARYLMGIDDGGQAFIPSPDPLLERLQSLVAPLKLATSDTPAVMPKEVCRALYSDTSIFVVDLYQIGLGEKIEGYLSEMLQGPGSVRKTLKKYFG